MQVLAEREEIIEIRKLPQKISLSKHPSCIGQCLVDIMQTHHCPGLVNDLKVFLNTCQMWGQGDPLSKRRLELMQVPFDRLNVYHGFKFLREELTIDETEERLQEKDRVRACPSSTKQEERFDPVVVIRSEDCELTGVQGMF
jgi:hypothetical protein